jgi:hypothetical protein
MKFLFPHSRRMALGLAAALLGLAGCSREGGSTAPEQVVEMGTAVTVGPLSYTILDQRWHDSLPGGSGARMPNHRFLTLSLSVTNTGSEDAGIPLLSLIGSDGKEYQELSEGEGVTGWMGYIRLVDPAQTEHGRIVFDVPPGAYQLRVSSGGEPESEVTALVNIPFRIETPTTVDTETLQPANP